MRVECVAGGVVVSVGLERGAGTTIGRALENIGRTAGRVGRPMMIDDAPPPPPPAPIKTPPGWDVIEASEAIREAVEADDDDDDGDDIVELDTLADRINLDLDIPYHVPTLSPAHPLYVDGAVLVDADEAGGYTTTPPPPRRRRDLRPGDEGIVDPDAMARLAARYSADPEYHDYLANPEK